MVSSRPEPIAVVGSGCRFPGSASSPSALWKLLEKPRDVSKEIPDDRFELKGYYHAKGAHHGTTNVTRAYMLDEDVRVFDATFFNISPNEADAIDPQQRLLMEVVYEALEAGGHPIEGLRGSDTAVYVGTMSVDYNDILIRDIDTTPTYFSTGTSRAILANRISYFFDWHGPSMTIDTACSSSMVALHQSVQSLRNGEARVAIAGGTELLLGPEQFVGESKMNLLSPDGRSRMWDSDANGYARGDGIAAVVLKKLSDAIADGDHIQCLIRETGVNQDGKSTGLTVPSSEAQTALIRQTYARAGLDISNPEDCPQFFEAHGTGTKVGDPREAAAISECFGRQTQSLNGNPLYVGSIKTIIGHTEGTAGLAGVLKACLAIQNGVLPPNLLLNRLNPEVAQYCDNLLVPTTLTIWPALPEGVPRRASVNSFGFGGTNGHAIVESYEPSLHNQLLDNKAAVTPFTPFTFSTATDESLVALLQSYSDFLKSSDSEMINLSDMAWTLQSRRSALPFKVAFAASTVEGLASKIDKKLEQTKSSPPGTSVGVRSSPAKPQLLGVFTGQGAQWATMGAQLIKASAVVREKIDQMDHSLATLPEADRPSWKIADQISAAKGVSRLGEAALSQPLCTAVQVVLVDLLRGAGVTFKAVVGHSSGEIAAAYAADFISAHDAIRIAYYRGVHAKLSKGAKGQKGAMLAVGTSWEDAQELLDLPAFRGRVKIAAQNSPASLTLSGDADGIAHAKRVFDEEKKFARLLLVDTAYHSHHMIPCSQPYVHSLRTCGIQVNYNRDTSCTWYSSVKHGEPMQPTEELGDLYWRDNMVNAVLFADAVKAAAGANPNLAVEVGPHPALKGPAQQNLADVPLTIPYTGVLARSTNDVEAFSDGLGFIWTHLGPGAVDFQTYQRLVSPGNQAPKLCVGLPSYPWNHGRVHWHESRLTKKSMARGAAFHELLGVPSPNNTDLDLRWTNFLKASEIPWLDGHQLQGQTVFPAAGYVAMALEAGKKLAGSRNVKILEVQDLTIGKAIAFDEGATFAAETLVALTGVSPARPNMKTQTADFAVYSCPNTGTMDMELVSSGKVKIVYGTPSFSTLSSQPLDDSNMTEIDSERFYSSLSELGYGYNGPFRTLARTKRRLDQASATATTYGYSDDDDTLIVHPTILDVAFQASFLAQSSPGDEQLWSLHVPTSIKCIRVNPELCASLPTSPTDLPLSAVLHTPESGSISMRSSIDVFSEDGQETLIQVEELVMEPFSPATAADDRPMYSITKYGVSTPNANTIVAENRPSTEEIEIAALCERVAYYYLRKWKSEIADEQWAESGEKHHHSLKEAMDRLLSNVDSGRHPTVKKEWATDDEAQLNTLISRYPKNVDLKLISAVGESMPAVLQGKSTISEVMQQDKMLERLFSEGIGYSQYNDLLARMMQQITHRYPHAKILETCAGNSHATNAILNTIGSTFSSYTYTDISEAYVEQAAESFKERGQKMSFKVFDSEKKPSSQGLDEHSYDVVIASNALHTTSSLQETLENTRRLLKPGGYLLLSGITNNGPIRIQMMLGGLPEWWVGLDNSSRKTSPSRTATWHNALRKAGFSGVDTITPEVDGVAWPFSVIVTQAVDSRIDFLRKPISASSSVQLEELVILGNGTLKTSRIAEEIAELAETMWSRVTILEGLPTDDDEISPMATFVNLVDLDEPIFGNLSEDKMEGLKTLFEFASNIVWVTEGARTDEPYHNASIGFGRSIAAEMPHLSLQFLDLDGVGNNASRIITEAVLRLAAMEEWDTKGTLHQELLWSKEPELYLESGQLMVPRIVSNDEQNARINSLRRTVNKTLDPRTATVYVSQAADSSLILCEEPTPRSHLCDGESSVQIKHSSLNALNIAPDTFLYLGLGENQATGEATIILSETNSSIAVSSTSVSVPDISPAQGPVILAATASELLASSLLSGVSSKCHILVHEPGQDGIFANALAQQAATKDIRITFSSTSDCSLHKSWIHLDPWTSEHAVQKWLPTHLTHFVDLAVDDEAIDASLSIQQCLPSGCRQIHVGDLFRQRSLVLGGIGSVSQLLQDAVRRAQSSPALSKTAPEVIQAGQITNSAVSKYPSSIIDWSQDNALTVQVQPINPSRLFSSDKTYLLVGLSGQLGQSLCEWMSRHGAGYICLTSRRPKWDENWQASMKRAGTTVEFLAMDVTKKQDVQRVVDEVSATYPPIAGVANGAALFHDAPFSEMSLEIMEDVLKPKVDGTRYLDEVFGDTELDFFIVFSSLTSVLGNSGQSNYTAANAYMTGLMSQRRKRGLAGTSLDIGLIYGIGMGERAGDVAREQLIRYGFMPISETDFHQLFAEAIRASSPSSGLNPIVTTGCRTARDDEEEPVQWINNPRLSHKIIIEAQDGGSEGGGGKKSVLPVRDQLAEARTKEEALEILKECFAAKLAMISRLADGQVGHNVPLVELGIDSLVAVEVRGWFLKELKTDMPVLKVLGGGSVADLCQQALEKLPETLVPKIGAAGTGKAKASEVKAAPKGVDPKPKGPTKRPIVSTRPTESSTTTTSSASSSPGRSPGNRSPAPATPLTPLSATPSSLDLAAALAAKQPKPVYAKSELVSFAQSRFWYLMHLMDDQTTFNVTFYCRLMGNLRIGDLERAVRLVTNRHESLRTCFVADEKEADLAWQNVLPNSRIRLEHKKISKMEELQAEYEEMKSIPFDLESGNLMRLILLSLTPTEHYLLFNYHHILMDGVSLQNFLADLEKAYKRQPLGVAPRQIPDFSRSQHEAFENGDFDDEIAYWRSEFPNGQHPVLPLLPMAQVNSRMPMKTFQVNQVECRLGSELMARIRDKSKAHRSTTFHFYLAAFKAMLFRFTDVDDLTIGIADANRNDWDVMGSVGLLLNLLTLRFKRGELDQQFGDSVSEARVKTYDALAHSRVPFDVLLKELNVPRSASYSPFFQAFLDYRQGHQEKMPFGNAQLEFMEIHPGRTAYDMTLDITDSPDSARIQFRTQAGLYDLTAAQLLLDTYVNLLEAFASDTSLQLREPALFSDEDLKRAINAGRGPSLKSSWPGGTLPHRIEQVAAANKDKVALRDGHDRVLTYAAMSDRIEAISEELQKNNVTEGSRVLVFQDATADWPCSMLAIMRVGAVYVPLDLRNPLPRLADVAGSCQPAVILTDNTTIENAPHVNISGAKIVNVDEVGPKPSSCVPNSARADAVAAILYTSGSTGKPKGIVVKHSGLRNEIEGYTTQWGLKAENTLQQSAFTFNHSSDQMYTGLVNGGSVYIVPWSKRGDPIEVTKLIQEQGITYTKATPAEYSLWLDYGRDNLKNASKWRFAFGGGESLTSTLVRDLAALDLPQLRFFNSYGPTEISISSTKMEVAYREPPPEGRIPCGYSLPNYTQYILDEHLKPVPIGMPGELWIGGAGVSLGYLNNKELTDHHFVPDPYVTPEYITSGWTRMYRTGDIAHLQADGAMVFHNRVAGDTQVKIRGLRIELEDIESNIVQAARGALKEAAVTLRDGESSSPFLVAHVVFAPQHDVSDTDAFLQQLLRKLQVPQYMVPVMAIPLERMPLTNHSKVDRKALRAMPLPQRDSSSKDASGEGSEEDQLSETMTQLKRVWEEILNTKRLGLSITPSTSFFTIGGNSLLIVRLQSHIRKVFNVTVRLVDLLDANTLAEMAKQIEESTSVSVIDWEKETALPDLSLPGQVDVHQPIKTTNKVVLFTGAGGFLGKHILAQLIASPDIAKIHCIGLREKPAGTPRKLAVSPSPKIVMHRGDLSEPWLGLSQTEFMEMAGEVDSILHIAAVRSFWDNYHLLRPSNITPTQQLVRMAAPRHIPIHYVSSAGVVPKESIEGAPESVAAHPPASDGSDGYLATRWASEQILERASSILGVPIFIHRFTPPKTSTSKTSEMVTTALEHFAKFVEEMSTMPDWKGVKGHFDMTPAARAAGELAAGILGGKSENETSSVVRFLHHDCEVQIDVNEMMAFLAERVQKGSNDLETMPGLRFLGRTKALGLGYFITSQELYMEGTTEEGKMVVLASRR
ncbi:hypothetical protein B0T17DRAFT_562985 [Bombardia bombarda]|uniref:Uncharacterized protein n=1 Tax=Bombardia bombarda TaxID=252184 RepID=A0AA39WGC1_9PEZI|nr:hypothetical protein B0T17DRAFT_562985 [Bombardia bombarda]